MVWKISFNCLLEIFSLTAYAINFFFVSLLYSMYFGHYLCQLSLIYSLKVRPLYWRSEYIIYKSLEFWISSNTLLYILHIFSIYCILFHQRKDTITILLFRTKTYLFCKLQFEYEWIVLYLLLYTLVSLSNPHLCIYVQSSAR